MHRLHLGHRAVRRRLQWIRAARSSGARKHLYGDGLGGDGRTDIVVDNGGTLGVYLSTGGTAWGLCETTTMSDAGGCVYFAFDADGDGLEDLGCWTPLSGAVSYQPHNGAGTPADLVNSIKDGYLNSISLTYTSIVQGDYTNSCDATQGSGYRAISGHCT